MTLGLRAAFGLTVFLGACVQPEPAPIVDGTALLAEAAELPPCADDGPRFPITGLCIGRSVAYLYWIGIAMTGFFGAVKPF